MSPCFNGSIAPAFGNNSQVNNCGCAGGLTAQNATVGMGSSFLIGLALAFGVYYAFSGGNKQ